MDYFYYLIGTTTDYSRNIMTIVGAIIGAVFGMVIGRISVYRKVNKCNNFSSDTEYEKTGKVGFNPRFFFVLFVPYLMMGIFLITVAFRLIYDERVFGLIFVMGGFLVAGAIAVLVAGIKYSSKKD